MWARRDAQAGTSQGLGPACAALPAQRRIGRAILGHAFQHGGEQRGWGAARRDSRYVRQIGLRQRIGKVG